MSDPAAPPADRIVDVAVVGGGPAGTSAAVWAARYRRRVVVFDTGEPRNRWSEAAHGYLGFDRTDPGELLQRFRADLDGYPNVSVVPARVESIVPNGDTFTMQVDGERWTAFRIILATGVRDEFPEIGAFEDHFGVDVVTCPSCDGYESRDRVVAVIGSSEQELEFAAGLLDWARMVVVIDAREEDAAEAGQVGSTGIDVVRGRPVALAGGDDGRLRGIHLADGREIPCEIAFCTMSHRPASDLATNLGCEFTEQGCLRVDEHGLTSVPGVYAAGDITPGPHLVQVAAAKGAVAGIAAAMSLRGEAGAPQSPTPAPDADELLGTGD